MVELVLLSAQAAVMVVKSLRGFFSRFAKMTRSRGIATGYNGPTGPTIVVALDRHYFSTLKRPPV